MHDRLKKSHQPTNSTDGNQWHGSDSSTAIVEPQELSAQELPSGGYPLNAQIRRDLEPKFGFDFGQVRIHTEQESDQLNQALGAEALTYAQDIYFRAGKYDPHSRTGQHLLAHELTHVAQQAGQNGGLQAKVALSQPRDTAEQEAERIADRAIAGDSVQVETRTPLSSSVSHPNDAAEQEADTVADRVIAGESVQVQAQPSAAISRSVWDWVEETASDAGSWVSDTASDAWDATSDAASSVGNWIADTASDAWDTTSDAASSAWDWTKDTASDIHSGMKTASQYVHRGEEWFSHRIDDLETMSTEGWQMLAETTDGIPVLDDAMDGMAWLGGQGAQLTGGLLKGAGSLVGGVASMVVDPVDTAIGLEAMAEHVPMGGLMPNPLKLAHGLYDVAFNDQDFGDMANHVFNPLQSTEEDGKFWKNVGSEFIRPYKEAIEHGKYAEAGGRGLFDIGSLVFTAGGGTFAEGAAGAGRVAAIAGDVGDAARIAEGASVAGDAARMAEGADLASGASRAAEVADVANDAARMAEGAELSGNTARAGEDLLFSGLTDEEIGGAIENARGGLMVEAPARPPLGPDVPGGPRAGFDVRPEDPGLYWTPEADSGMIVQKYRFPARRGLPQRDPAGNIVTDAAGEAVYGDVRTEMRIHSPAPTAPIGSASAEGWTVGFEQGNARMTAEGQWFDTRFSELPSGGRIDVRPFRRGASGEWLDTRTGAAVTDAETVSALEQWDRNMASSHIPLP